MIKLILSLIFFTVFLSGCGSSTPSKKSNTITLKSQPFTTSLFYSGSVQPYKTIVVTTPAEGVIQETFFHYGDLVKQGQLLFTISSEKFQTDYKNALMAYLKAKSEFDSGTSQLKEGKFLHDNQLISDDDFKTKQTAFYNAQLSYIQAQDTLSLMLNQLDIKDLKLDDLSIQNINKINEAMNSQGNMRSIRVIAPVSGVILMPVKADNGDSDTKKLAKGDSIKQGDALAVIGDTSGLSIRVNVNEFNINQLKPGQKVTVTGAAFPDFVLQGEISGMDKQAQASQGGMPIFPVDIVVRNLTAQQQAIIHPGMSAKVAINIVGPSQMTVPFSAITQKNGTAYLNIKDSKTGKISEVPVKTGQTTEDSVVILSSLKEGESVVLSH